MVVLRRRMTGKSDFRSPFFLFNISVEKSHRNRSNNLSEQGTSHPKTFSLLLSDPKEAMLTQRS
jgi:hypothetical protein